MDVTESHVTMQRSVLVMALSMPVHASSATRGSTVKVREAISNRLRFIDYIQIFDCQVLVSPRMQ